VADLYLSGGDTLSDGPTSASAPDGESRPPARHAGSRPWDRHAVVPATAADRGTFWEPDDVETVQYPTRMARRRALEAAQILDGWRPDPVLTPPLLQRLGEELLRLFDGSVEPEETTESDQVESDVTAPLPVGGGNAPARRRRWRGGEPSTRRSWRRRRRSATAVATAADATGVEEPGATPPTPQPAVVRQDDPVDDAAWFAGLKEMARADADDAESLAVDVEAAPEAPVAETAVTPPARPTADVQQIVPASVPRAATGSRRRWIAAAVAVLVVLVAGVGVALSRGGGEHAPAGGAAVTPQDAVVVAFSLSPEAAEAARTPQPKSSKKKGQPAPTVVQPLAGDVTGLSLLAAGGGSAQQVLVPSRLLLDVPGAGRVPMTRSLTGSPNAPAEAVADALEIKVDTTWILDTDALAALVDRVGGVVVDVDTDVTQGTQVGAAVLLGAGQQQKLAGAQAALFAQFLGADEPEAARLARQEQVLRAVLAGLPDRPAAVRAVLSELPGAPTGRALDTVVNVVSASRLAAVQGELASTMLPVKEIDAGGTVTSYGLDDKAAAQLVGARLAGAKLPVAAVGHVRVLVQNGVGAPGLGEAARSQLLAAGLRYVAGGNLPGFGQEETVVLLRDASSANRQRGMAVARSLGLGESSLRISESAPTVADVVVILGSDYRPA
jgi:hypothetical protein